MDQTNNPNHWRHMFDRGRRDQPPEPYQYSPSGQPNAAPQAVPLGGFDDGYNPAQRRTGTEPTRAPLTPEEITDEAAMALALDTQEYRPWVLQRGTRPVMMLHLRRYEPKSGLWMGWQMSYPHLVAVEYIGDKILSLDFGTRQFVIEGKGLDELARHLQEGTVLVVQEYAESVWPNHAEGRLISAVNHVSAEILKRE